MTDVSGEMPTELVPPVLPAPEAIAEVETAAPQAAAVGGLAPATDDRSTNVEIHPLAALKKTSPHARLVHSRLQPFLLPY
jgi:hypothetical protein